jgi:ABC-type branched-subunit amino acid transport system permease subunit
MIWNNVIIASQVDLSLQGAPFTAMTILLLTLLAAGAAGALLGLLSGYPAVRLGGDYLAISLLAFGEVLAIIGNNYDLSLGGRLGSGSLTYGPGLETGGSWPLPLPIAFWPLECGCT